MSTARAGTSYEMIRQKTRITSSPFLIASLSQTFYIRKGRPHGHRYGKNAGCKQYHTANQLQKKCRKRGYNNIHDRFIRDTWFRKSMLEMDRTEEVIREMDRLRVKKKGEKGRKKEKKREKEEKKKEKKREKEREKGRKREKKGEKGRKREEKGRKGRKGRNRGKRGKKGKRKKEKNRFIRDLWFRKTMIELGRSEEVILEMDRFANEDHTHIATEEEEIDVYRRNWWIRSNFVGSDTMPVRHRPDVKQALSTLHRLKKAEDEAYYHNWSQSSSSSWWQWQTSWWHPSFETSPATMDLTLIEQGNLRSQWNVYLCVA